MPVLSYALKFRFCGLFFFTLPFTRGIDLRPAWLILSSELWRYGHPHG